MKPLATTNQTEILRDEIPAPQADAIAFAIISVTLNGFYAAHLYQDWQATSSLCRNADRYMCAMRPAIISTPLDEAPPAVDVIGQMIKDGEAHGLAIPPRSGKGS